MQLVTATDIDSGSAICSHPSTMHFHSPNEMGGILTFIVNISHCFNIIQACEMS